VPSVVVAGGLVIACTPKNNPVFAIKPGGTGEVTEDPRRLEERPS
jgi:hypothetical protein